LSWFVTRKERERETISLKSALFTLHDAFYSLSPSPRARMGGHQHNDDSKVSLTPPHLLDVIDELWLEDSLPFDDVDVPSSMRLFSSQNGYYGDACDDVTSSSSGNDGGATTHHPGVGVAFSAGGGGGGGGGSGARGAGAGFNADDGVGGGGGDEDRNEERWGRGR
jgi:hypothetical protein